jgi:hypothetical protein
MLLSGESVVNWIRKPGRLRMRTAGDRAPGCDIMRAIPHERTSSPERAIQSAATHSSAINASNVGTFRLSCRPTPIRPGYGTNFA